jgi:Zn-dependent protease with chaperone function
MFLSSTRILYVALSFLLVLVHVSSSINIRNYNQLGYSAVERKGSFSTQISVKSPGRIKKFINRIAKTGRDLPIGALYIGFAAFISTTFSVISIFNRSAALLILKTVTATAKATAESIIFYSLLFEIPFIRESIYCAINQQLFGVSPKTADAKLTALVQEVAKNSGLRPIRKVYLIKSNQKNANCLSIGTFSAVAITQVSFVSQLPSLL